MNDFSHQPKNNKTISATHLHIVCLDVPYPPDYGGVFDLFYKIKALHELGIKIHLHCFEYGRGEQPELNPYCSEIHYYKRERMTIGLPLRLPYMVTSRINPQLIQNISNDNYPILLEGIHCTYYLYHGDLNNRMVLVRLHNVEYEYYRRMAGATSGFYKKIYYFLESRLLKKYERSIASKARLMAVNDQDRITYEKNFSAKDILFLPVFLPFSAVKSQPGKGDYCLYHGNLSVGENEKAAIWLLRNVVGQLEVPVIIAGKNPSHTLKKEIAKTGNVQLVANPSQEEMQSLITHAHIHLIPSFNNTGIKIKLLNALFNGRFIIANKASLLGTGLESLCVVEETPSGFIRRIREQMNIPFGESNIRQRKEILTDLYDNKKNAVTLSQWL